jgi:hypothetical protein
MISRAAFRRVRNHRDAAARPRRALIARNGNADARLVYSGDILRIIRGQVRAAIRVEHPPFAPCAIPNQHRIRRSVVYRIAKQRLRHELAQRGRTKRQMHRKQ